MKKVYGYARVSTKEQHLDRQIRALLQYGVEERDIITDQASGAFLDRPGYQSLKYALLRPGDELVIPDLDRLSRNKEHIIQELRYYKEQHIQVRILNLPTTLIELPSGQEWVFQMINNILTEVLSSIAEQERLTIRQRQAEGIAAAREKGKHLGRKETGFPPNWEEVYHQWKDGAISPVAAMRELGMKKSSFYNYVHRYEGTSDSK